MRFCLGARLISSTKSPMCGPIISSESMGGLGLQARASSFGFKGLALGMWGGTLNLPMVGMDWVACVMVRGEAFVTVFGSCICVIRWLLATWSQYAGLQAHPTPFCRQMPVVHTPVSRPRVLKQTWTTQAPDPAETAGDPQKTALEPSSLNPEGFRV